MEAHLRLALLAVMAALVVACNTPAALTRLTEAERQISALHVAFTASAEASNRVVMAADEADTSAAVSAVRETRAAAEAHLGALRATLESLGYAADLELLNAFATTFDEYGRLSDEVLSLAADNSNLEAQRLSFGPAAEASEAFRAALEAVPEGAPAADAPAAREQAWRAYAALLEVRALHARHIAEPGDPEMDAMEAAMAASARHARAALAELRRMGLTGAAARLDPAGEALDRFLKINDEIVALSRRNSNVRALALTLGRKRVVTAECEVRLRALEEALAKHAFTATR